MIADAWMEVVLVWLDGKRDRSTEIDTGPSQTYGGA